MICNVKAAVPRIISASRRTDIPAFYAEWFINRIRAGYCVVPNPYHRAQRTRVSLLPEDVDAIVFWTRNPRPLFPHLEELYRRGYRYYFQYTLMDNPRWLDAHTPGVEAALSTFSELAGVIGGERLVWRYDPMVFTRQTGAEFHREKFERIAAALAGHTRRVTISVMDAYPKIAGRMRRAVLEGGGVETLEPPLPAWFADLIGSMVQIAGRCGMEIVSCAERLDLRPLGVHPGKCLDDELIHRVFGLQIDSRKDPYQRAACGCVASKDIGVYDTCLFGCRYCYATRSFDVARANHAAHDPHSASLV